MDVVPLVNVRGDDILLCGVKGAQIGELISIGLPVPPGFVVTTEAYKDFMEDSGLDDEIADILSQVNKLFNEYHDVAANIQSLTQKVGIDGSLSRSIMKEFGKLGADYVAVRGSTVVKDDPMVYYEGRVATSLNVLKENLLENIEFIWASLYSARSLEFMYQNDYAHRDVMVAVVVQQMVNAAVSGVVYTQDPEGKEENAIVVEAGWGLGEAMISGIVSPDRYVVDKESLEVKDFSIGVQLKEVMREDDHHRIIDVPKTKQKKRKLTDEQVLELARLCVQVEDYYKSPQRLEWALGNEEEHVSILQTKAILE
jgi:pyruvate, water dikinase